MRLVLIALLASIPVASNPPSRAVAVALWNGAFKREPAYFDGFIDGMYEAEEPTVTPDLRSIGEAILTYSQLAFEKRAFANYQASNSLFTQLADNPDLIERIPQRLYCQVLKTGSGLPLTPNTGTIDTHYLVIPAPETSEREQPYANTWIRGDPVHQSLGDLLPGMAHAMLGMQVGEVRRIYAHPDLAYGVSSNFEPGVSLIIDVELIDAHGPPDHLPSIPPPASLTPVSDHQLQSALQEVGRHDGFITWSHLKSGNDIYSLQKVVTALADLQQSHAEPIYDDEMTDLFSKIQVTLLRRQTNPSASPPRPLLLS